MTDQPSSEGISEHAAELVDRVRMCLEPDGWVVTVRPPGDGGMATRIRVSHPLSIDYGIGSIDDGSDAGGFVEKALGMRELEVIRARPATCPHESLLQSFRQAAIANGWDPSVLAIVARVLRHEGLLTEDEANWLEDAGPAWWPDMATEGRDT